MGWLVDSERYRVSVRYTDGTVGLARLSLQQRAYVLGLRRGQARARAEREQLADRFEETIEAIHAEMAEVRACLHKVKLQEAERDPHSWLH